MKALYPASMLVSLFLLAGCATRQSAAVPKAVPAQAEKRPEREERLVIAYNGEEGKTALELLKARAKVRTSSSSMGELIEEINGIASGNGAYLIWFLNGATAKTGAADYITKNTDRIEWKLIGPKKTQPEK